MLHFRLELAVDMGDKMNYDDLMTGFKAGHDVSLDNFSSTAMTAFALQAIHEQGPVLDHRTSNQTDLMFNLQPLVQNLVSAEDRTLTHQSLYLLQRLRMDVRAPIRPRITSNSGQKFHQLVEKVKFVETSALYKLMSMHPAQLSSIFN